MWEKTIVQLERIPLQFWQRNYYRVIISEEDQISWPLDYDELAHLLSGLNQTVWYLIRASKAIWPRSNFHPNNTHQQYSVSITNTYEQDTFAAPCVFGHVPYGVLFVFFINLSCYREKDCIVLNLFYGFHIILPAAVGSFWFRSSEELRVNCRTDSVVQAANQLSG